MQVGHAMRLLGGKVAKISAIEEVMLDVKVNVETSTGLLYTNGVFTTGICEYGPKEEEREKEANIFLCEYRSSHFGTQTAVF